MTEKITRERGNKNLMELARHLYKIPPRRFDYTRWAEKRRGCGTVACALGHAAMMPRFKKLGLRLEQAGWAEAGGLIVRDTCGEVDPLTNACPRGVDAGMRIFHLTWNQSYTLFTPQTGAEADATPKQVAAKIRKFVRDRQRK